jgi:hypothetical protein
MTPDTPNRASTITPADRAAFDAAMTAVRADHAVLRDLAVAATRHAPLSTDDTLSLADAMLAHESAETRLFSLPFVSAPPASVISTAARARKCCLEYTTGTFRLPDPHAAAALFIDALLTHLAVEDAWLDHESEHVQERMHTIA